MLPVWLCRLTSRSAVCTQLGVTCNSVRDFWKLIRNYYMLLIYYPPMYNLSCANVLYTNYSNI